MGDRTRGWLFRTAGPTAVVLATVSGLPLVLFVLSINTVQMHWWPTPWGPERARLHLSLSVAFGIAYALI